MESCRLSICIPTYNRAGYIGATLENILGQAPDDVEVVVVDGASKDDTAEVVGRIQRSDARVRFHRQATNGGVDGDLDTAVQLARGEYCWLMSSDDLLAPGALSRMLGAIAEGPGIVLCNIVMCTKDLEPVRPLSWFAKDVPERTFDASTAEGFREYLRAARSLGALFSYMPAIAVRRSDWLGVVDRRQFFGSCYAHAHTLFPLLLAGSRLKYVPDALVLTRFGNDSFSSQGYARRLMIDFEGYMALADRFCAGDPIARESFLEVMTYEHRWHRLVRLRSTIVDPSEWDRMRRTLLSFGYSAGFVRSVAMVGSFRRTIGLVHRVKRRVKPL